MGGAQMGGAQMGMRPGPRGPKFPRRVPISMFGSSGDTGDGGTGDGGTGDGETGGYGPTADGRVLGTLLSYWGQSVPPAPAWLDLDGDGVIGSGDLGQWLAANWSGEPSF